MFIDPLVPEDLWPELDALVAGRPVSVLTTIRWHGRSRDAVLERYGGTEEVPAEVRALPFPDFGETIYVLPEPRALVPGDLLIGDGAGGVRMCPSRGSIPARSTSCGRSSGRCSCCPSSTCSPPTGSR